LAVINVETLLRPIQPDAPCGENLRWDRRFLELERLAVGKEDTQFSTAEPPNWREVQDVCVEVFARGKHLRTAVLLTLAALKMEGYPGLRDGLKLLRGLLEQYWDQVFPQLDVEDNNDPTERVNSLAPFATAMATFGDKLRMLDSVYDAPLCDSRQLGRFSMRDIAIAAGTQAAPENPSKPPASMKTIDVAFGETDKPILEGLAAAADEGGEALKAIDNVFTAKCGPQVGPDLLPLQTMLKDAALQIRRRMTASDSALVAGGGGNGEVSGGVPGPGGDSRGAALSGDISSSKDVLVAFEKVMRYYETWEPSSPVPLLIQCARQMVKRKFLDISKVLTADAVVTLERISNSSEEASGAGKDAI